MSFVTFALDLSSGVCTGEERRSWRDPGPMFRRALSWLPAHFVSVDQDVSCAPPRFSSTDHLATEAVAAYVDGELPMKAHLRAPPAICRPARNAQR